MSHALTVPVGQVHVLRHPQRFTRDQFYPLAYRMMYYGRRMEDRLLELFQKGYVKGTVTSSAGNEATALGMSLPLHPGKDPVSLLHRDFVSHLVLGADPYRLVCQYMANAQSPTQGREGNCHHGDAARRRFPMMSHLGKMLSPVVGATWAARRRGEDVVGLTVIGDGGSSTGEFHESINLAAVQNVPVLFVVENNGWSFSTPVSQQYRCRQLSDRAIGFGVPGATIDGTDAWTVYTAVCDALDAMRRDSAPFVLECMCLRLQGHAAYDKGEYMDPQALEAARLRDPLRTTRGQLMECSGFSETDVQSLEAEVDEQIHSAVALAVKVPRVDPLRDGWTPYAEPYTLKVEPFQAPKLKNGEAIRRGLEYILANDPRAYLLGLDIGTYGSAFKTCKGLIERFGPQRVLDMPICESGMAGFALGSSQVGARPIFEFQFADFSTEACTQIGLNAGTWFYRSGCAAPLVFRLPCGGGLTMGAFHSGEFEGLWSRFPGLKLLYPATAQECFEAIVAAYYDPNPCLVFEHKLLYWSKSGDVSFDGDLTRVWRSRRYTEGDELTVVATGAMVHEALAAAQRSGRGVEVWNPFVLAPMDVAPLAESLSRTRRLLVVQECPRAGGLGDSIVGSLVRGMSGTLACPPRLLSAPDVPVPFAPELEAHSRPNAEKILASIRNMLGEG